MRRYATLALTIPRPSRDKSAENTPRAGVNALLMGRAEPPRARPPTDLCPRNNNQPATVTRRYIPLFEGRHVNSIGNASSRPDRCSVPDAAGGNRRGSSRLVSPCIERCTPLRSLPNSVLRVTNGQRLGPLGDGSRKFGNYQFPSAKTSSGGSALKKEVIYGPSLCKYRLM